jgi:hypothetical protein
MQRGLLCRKVVSFELVAPDEAVLEAFRQSEAPVLL